MSRRILALALAAAALLAASPAGALERSIEAVVAAETADARDSCGDRGVRHAPAFATPADLDGDGRDDLVLDHQHLVCGSGQPPRCGSGGCAVRVFLATDEGFEPILRQVGDGFTLADTPAGPELAIPQRGPYPPEVYRFEAGCAVPTTDAGMKSCEE